MVRWIIVFAVLCATSALIGFGSVVSPASVWRGISLAVSAFSAVLLIASFDAFETQGPSPDES